MDAPKHDRWEIGTGRVLDQDEWSVGLFFFAWLASMIVGPEIAIYRAQRACDAFGPVGRPIDVGAERAALERSRFRVFSSVAHWDTDTVRVRFWAFPAPFFRAFCVVHVADGRVSRLAVETMD